jgi:dihydrofolate synthase/folylpolyglutamate synthase
MALAAAFDELRPLLRGGAGPRPGPATLVLAIMGDKDVAGVLGALAAAPSLDGVRVIATQVEGPRAMPAAALAAQWAAVAGERSGPIGVIPEPAAAVAEAVARAEGPVVVAGSLYLVGAARALVVDDPDLRDPA